MDTKKKAVILLSGGLDSATVLAIAKAEGYEPYALSFSYGQRHAWELEAAKRVAASIGVAQHRIAAYRSSRLRRLRAHRRHRRSQRPRCLKRCPTAFPSPMCPRATPSFFPLRWPGPRCWARATFFSASTRSTTPAIPIAAPNSSRPLKRWRTSPPKLASKAASISRFTPRSSP